MLMTRTDAAHSDEEEQAFLREQDFGQLIASGDGRDLPVVIPVHYVYAPEQWIERLSIRRRRSAMATTAASGPGRVTVITHVHQYRLQLRLRSRKRRREEESSGT